MSEKRLHRCMFGYYMLVVFVVFTVVSVLLLGIGCIGGFRAIGSLDENPLFWAGAILTVCSISFILFWVGMITVYAFSIQLGIRIRAIGLLVGLIPVLNIVLLVIIMRIAGKEVKLENDKVRLNRARAAQQICHTKYPILLVHGVFFRDSDRFNYWGRVPQELEKNGAEIYYGDHSSAAAVEDSAKELEKRILDIVWDTGCEKVNIIAHSKGGLDSRTAIAHTEAGKHIASLTTINTPHHGCEFAEYLLDRIPEAEQQIIAAGYNAAAKALGDPDPDFLAAVTDLTAYKCEERNEIVKDDPNVFYQAFGSILKKRTSGQFPLNLTYPLVSLFDGPNDGLVGYDSFLWDNSCTMLEPTGKRGISHADVIDLNREDIEGFDVREFYVGLVADLKKRGF